MDYFLSQIQDDFKRIEIEEIKFLYKDFLHGEDVENAEGLFKAITENEPRKKLFPRVLGAIGRQDLQKKLFRGTHALIYYGLVCICHRNTDPEKLCHQLSSFNLNDNANILLCRGPSTPELMNLARWKQECKSYFYRFFSKRVNDVICLPQHGDGLIRTLEEWCCDTKKSNKKGALIIKNIDLSKQMKFLGIQNSEVMKWEKSSSYLTYNCTKNVILYLQLAKDISSKESLNKEMRRCRSNIHLLINLYRDELENSGVTIVGIVISNSETQNLKLSCDMCNIFVTSKKVFEDLDSCKIWWNEISEWLKVDDLDQTKAENGFLAFGSKMLGLMACTDCSYLPNFTKNFASQIKQACIFLTPEQVDVTYYSKNYTILKGDFGTGKSIVLQKKLEILAKVIPEDEIIYYINYDGKSNFYITIRNFVEKTFPNTLGKVQIRKNVGRQKLSGLFKSINHEVDKRINSVHVFIDEYNGEDLTVKEVKMLKNNLDEKHFKHSIIFIAAQPIYRTQTFQYSGKKETSEVNLFSKVEGIFEIKQLTQVMRNTVQINTITKIVQNYLIDKKNEFIHQPSVSPTTSPPEKTSQDKQKMHIKGKAYLPRARQTNNSTETTSQDKPKIHKQRKRYWKNSLLWKKGNAKAICSSMKNKLTQPLDAEQTIKSTENLIDNDLDQPHKLLDDVEAIFDETVDDLKITSSYAYCESEIGHQIKSQNPKLIFPHQFENFFENVISYAAVLDSLKIQKRKTVIIHFEQSPPAILTTALKTLRLTVLDNVETFISSRDHPTLITNFQYVRGMEFENVIVVVDPDEYYLKHYIPEAITRCTTNLYLMLLEDKKKKKKEETVKGIVEQLEQYNPPVIEKMIIGKCKECDKDSNFYCYDSDVNPRRLGLHKSSQQFKKMEEFFDSTELFGEDKDISMTDKKRMLNCCRNQVLQNLFSDLTSPETTICDKDEENFIITSRVLDQLAYRTTEDQLKCLAKELKCKRCTVKKIYNDHKETYNKCYAMLTKLVEKSGRKDWLLMKDCYKKVQGGTRITEEVEALINQDQILAKYKDEYDRTNTKSLSKNIKLGREDLKSKLVSYFIGRDRSYTVDWKRLVRNMEFDTKYLDIDAMISNIDLNNERADDKCLHMLKELEKINGGELLWTQLKQALQRIDKTGCANTFEKWYKSIDVDEDDDNFLLDAETMLDLTQHVRSFSDALHQLRNTFKDGLIGEEYDKCDYQSRDQSILGAVLYVLKDILGKYPPLHSPDIIFATANIIVKVRTYNYSEGKDGPTDFTAAIDQLKLSFTSSVSSFLMVDADMVSLTSNQFDDILEIGIDKENQKKFYSRKL